MSNEGLLITPEPIKVRFCIPPLRTKIKLAEPWKFDLFTEYRNSKLIKALGFDYSYNIDKVTEVTLPKDTLLTVDRIYIRNGASNYDSVTFRIKKGECPDKKFESSRFWAKLYDVNTIVCYPIGAEDNDTISKVFQSFGVVGQRLLDL